MARIASVVLQSEAAECGLACLAMVARHHGLDVDLRTLRQRFPASLKGVTLAQLMRHAQQLHLATRALRCELDELSQLALPCIVHWNLDHFVVLERVGRHGVTIVDPAVGRVSPRRAEVSQCFTGIALELVPTADFSHAAARAAAPASLRLRDLAGRVVGLRRALAHVVLLAAVIELLALAVPVVTQFIVDGALVTGDRDLLLLSALGGTALVVVDFLLRTARGSIALRVQQDLALQWTANLFVHLLRLPLVFFERRHLGDIASRFTSLTAIRGTLTNGAVTVLVDGAMAVFTLLLMLVYDLRLACVATLAVALYATLRMAAYRPFRNATEERIVLAGRESGFFLETIRAVLPLRLNGRVGERVARWQNLMVDLQNRDTRTQRMSLWFTSTGTLLTGCEGMLLLYLGGRSVLDRSMTLGMLLAFLAYRAHFGERTVRLIDLAVEIRMLKLHAGRLADIALEPPEPDHGCDADAAALVPRLAMRDVSFRYAEGEPWILRGCHLVIEPGEVLAITGASGCGKSTLLKLLLGLHPPSEGDIRIGDAHRSMNVRQFAAATTRALMGTVLQDDTLLSGSLAENIACFDPQPDLAWIEHVARLAMVHDDIAAMPMGYRTLVGDMGSVLSGGQKQRVLLARALYRKPRILVLDEATSQLDVDHERRVNAAVRELGLTCIVIAHRPETIASAQRVVVLEGGRITQDHRRGDQGLPVRM